MKKLTAVLVAASLMLLSGCGLSEKRMTKKIFFAMDTVCFILLPENEIKTANAAVEAVAKLEKLLSATEDGSDISHINVSNGEKTAISEETAEIISKALAISSELPDFDVALGKVVKAWGICDKTDEPFSPPSPEEIARLLASLPSEPSKAVTVDTAEKTAVINGDVLLDLGAIAKGYACEKAIGLLKESGIENAAVNMGGNVGIIGKNASGKNWSIGIKKPYSETDETVGSISGESGMFYVTSGCYERYKTDSDGEKYCHIIDRKTASPVKTDNLSVTVVCSDGARADALSTAFYIMGIEKTMEYIENKGDCEALFITGDGNIVISAGMEKVFTAKDGYGVTVWGRQ